MLKPLLLPQLVEERKQKQTVLSGEMNVSQGSDIHDASSTQSPITPTFSTRGHGRYSSSVSSVDPLQSPLIEVPSSPAFAGKRPLPDVQEEPVEVVEREEHFETFDDVYDWSCDDTSYPSYTDAPAKSSVQISATSSTESSYDLSDGFITSPTIQPTTVGGTTDAIASPRTGRKRAHSDSPFAGIADRISGLSSSLSRKWRTRKSSNPLGMSPLVTTNNSVAPSTRSSSISNSLKGSQSQSGMTGVIYTDREPANVQLPPTPAISEFASRHGAGNGDHSGMGSHRESYASGIEHEDEDERVKAFATTPLLPPLLMGQGHADSDIPLQSPLQCPSVASIADLSLPPAATAGNGVSGSRTASLSGYNSPMIVSHSHTHSATHSLAATPALLPSPPLSTRPSFSSMPTLTMTSAIAPASFSSQTHSPTYPLSHTTHPSALLAQLTTSLPPAPTSTQQVQTPTSVPTTAATVSSTASVIATPTTILSPTEPSSASAIAPPSATIPFPPLSLELPDDKYSLLLGHANFTITPAPYTLPLSDSPLNLESLKQLRTDWESARTSFLRHLVRTGEHYGERSEVYKLTESKWGEIDAEWSSSFSSAVSSLSSLLAISEEEIKSRIGGSAGVDNSSAGDGVGKWECPALTQEGKWPKRGDEDIVGPMVREDAIAIAPEGHTMSRRNSTKERVKGFLKGMVGR